MYHYLVTNMHVKMKKNNVIFIDNWPFYSEAFYTRKKRNTTIRHIELNFK